MQAAIRGDEVAAHRAMRDKTYYQGLWKTGEQMFFDLQQLEKERPDLSTVDQAVLDADKHGDDFQSMRQWQIDREIEQSPK